MAEIGGRDALEWGRRLKPTLLKERSRGLAKHLELECLLGWGTGPSVLRVNLRSSGQAGMPVLLEERPTTRKASSWLPAAIRIRGDRRDFMPGVYVLACSSQREVAG